MLLHLGFVVTNRFRELERPQTGRLKDVVLMATVTGFESLRIPRKSDLKQFAELFEPLFLGSSNEARRQAAAALSQCPHVPESVALLIGSMPISIAAIFLTRSKAIPDRTLISIIRQHGPAHANAIAHREDISPSIVDALVEHHQFSAAAPRADPPAATAAPPAAAEEDRLSSDRVTREEELRDEIRALARAGSRSLQEVGRLQPIDELHQALLMRFARSGEAVLFATALAATLSASRALAERILLDVSGQQLAVTLMALDFPDGELPPLLLALYPHLSERLGSGNRAEWLIRSIDRKAGLERVESWLRADRDGAAKPARHESHLAENRGADPRRQESRTASAPPAAAQPKRTVGRK
ncbi:DUF2336 domain-containing protein [Sinorhizobium sp. CCBAU 05631]|uniref:DUF2336 domain-containing protein n=1 Tax=Sinorhizobium sp. CCBAU 05631 TaxID=794846 RepID=UPI0004AF1DB6|nr:DUF2336 domain-containing protein [Sinorhizobium sp. CCBAU 05631]ASY55693.1 hypothetical protein SS05631_c07400 [Sinorhizobium sp. CCBAU 05631]